MAISRMQEPRQLYGLGSLVKKAVRGVKKIVKSPLGKAALIGGLGFGLNKFGPTAGWFGKMTQGKGFSGLGSLIKRGAGSAFNWAKANPGKASFLGLGATALAAPFFMKGDDEEEVVEEAWDQVPSSIANIRNQARNYYTDPESSTLSFMPGKQFVNQNFYAANGGRAGLMNGGEPGQEQIEQMLMAEYVKYKNQGGTLSFEEFVQAVMQASEQQPEGAGMEQPQEVAMAANGGRIGYAGGQLVTPSADGSRPGYRGLLNLTMDNKRPPRNKFDFLYTTGPLSDDQKDILQNMTEEDWKEADKGGFVDIIIDILKTPYIIRGGETKEPLFADGGRIGYQDAGPVVDEETMTMIVDMNNKGMDISTISSITETPVEVVNAVLSSLTQEADGGRIGAYAGGLMVEDEDEYNYNPQAAMKMYRRPGKQEGGIMETEVAEEMIDLGGKEKDYRETGGFVDLGGKERADDVPARLSKNEFVFTADAVRNAGGGDIDKGSEVMQNLMDNLEAGGEVSEDSQGLEGAQAMYDQQQMLQSRIA